MDTSFSHFFLGRENTYQIHVQLLIGQTTHGFQKGSTADTTVKAFSNHDIVCFIIFEFDIGDDGFTDTDAKVFNGILITYCADINHQILNRNIVPAVTLRSGHKMRRFCCDHTGNIGTVAVSYQNLGGGQRIGIPAT